MKYYICKGCVYGVPIDYKGGLTWTASVTRQEANQEVTQEWFETDGDKTKAAAIRHAKELMKKLGWILTSPLEIEDTKGYFKERD
jgi:hypothetical protein